MAAATGILNGVKAPYCPGCGHTVITAELAGALEACGATSLDTVIVSDIGCCGLVDGQVATHTVHGLHGRAPALAVGVSGGLGSDRHRVVVIQGDGGATIGLQHILEAARQNADITLIVQNNLLYGMTGGQISGLSPEAFKAERLPEQAGIPPFDVCALARTAGAAFVARAFVGENLGAVLREAIDTAGFALVEIMEMCPSHGIRKMSDLKEMAAFPAMRARNDRQPFRPAVRETASLLDALDIIPARHDARLSAPVSVVLAGAAGGGIQSAGALLAMAGAACGLHATKKGEYPITVGTGFSVAEVILSREPVGFTGIEVPDVVVAVSPEGWAKVADRVGPATRVFVDEALAERAGSGVTALPLRRWGGRKGAGLAGVAFWIGESGLLPFAACEDAAALTRHGDAVLNAMQSGFRAAAEAGADAP